MINKLLILLFVLCTSIQLSAQTNHNLLQVANATYTELSGDTKIDIQLAEGDPYEIKDLYGETFVLYGKPWLMDTTNKGILVFPNAFIEVIEPGNFIICDALLRYLDSIDNNSKISYKIEGNSGNKILKVQWKNLKLRTGAAGNFVNLQIWLYQNDGMVEYRYGPSSANNTSGYTQATGPSVGISYSDFNFTNMVEKIWIYGTPPNIIVDSAHNANFPNIWGVPANGTIYRFIPKTTVLAASSQEAMNDGFSVYPSLANDRLIVSSKQTLAKPVMVKIVSIEGKLIQEQELKPLERQMNINTAAIVPGNYSVTITGEGIYHRTSITIAH